MYTNNECLYYILLGKSASKLSKRKSVSHLYLIWLCIDHTLGTCKAGTRNYIPCVNNTRGFLKEIP